MNSHDDRDRASPLPIAGFRMIRNGGLQSPSFSRRQIIAK
jgi:hypothetical protein